MYGCTCDSSWSYWIRAVLCIHAISDINRDLKENGATPIRNVEEDVFVEDTELVTLSSSAMLHTICQGERFNLENSMTENQQNDVQCLPGTGIIMQTLSNYLKNALISLLILTSLLFLNLPTLYAFLTHSEWENPTLMDITELTNCVWFCLCTLLPILIKLKLDPLSE